MPVQICCKKTVVIEGKIGIEKQQFSLKGAKTKRVPKKDLKT